MDEETKAYQEKLKAEGVEIDAGKEEVIVDKSLSGDFEDIKDKGREEEVENCENKYYIKTD